MFYIERKIILVDTKKVIIHNKFALNLKIGALF
jgi:hypothetical protein